MSDNKSCPPTSTDACGCAMPVTKLSPSAQQTCPQCGTKGKKVDLQTVKALVVNLEHVQPLAYRFCKTPYCQVVYFSEAGSFQLFESDLRERVHQKHPENGDVLVCYCFQHTPNSIRLEMAQGQNDVAERITALTTTNRCACEIRNPQGSCCLGNVRSTIKKIQVGGMKEEG